jgi:hypothetical protein
MSQRKITVTIDTAGQLGVFPRIAKVNAPEYTLDEVEAAGFLTSSSIGILGGLTDKDIVLVHYIEGTSFFVPSISNHVVTLTAVL